MFDDGDEKTLRRTQCVLKGEKHFIESEVSILYAKYSEELCLVYVSLLSSLLSRKLHRFHYCYQCN